MSTWTLKEKSCGDRRASAHQGRTGHPLLRSQGRRQGGALEGHLPLHRALI